MNINFELYKVFYFVAKNGNITKAAKELFISQPAISKSIKTLEGQLGGELFFRNKRGVILTDAGKELFETVKVIMEQFSAAESQFSSHINLKSGVLKIGVSTTIAREFLINYLKNFRKKYSAIDITIDTNPSSKLLEKLNLGLLDIVFMTLPGEVSDNVTIIECMEINDCLVGDHNTSINSISINELNNYSLILQDKNSNTRKFIDDYALKNSVALKPKMEFSSYSLSIDFIKLGLGIGFAVKEFSKQDLINGTLKEISILPTIPSRHIVMVVPKTRSVSNSAKMLIEIVN